MQGERDAAKLLKHNNTKQCTFYLNFFLLFKIKVKTLFKPIYKIYEKCYAKMIESQTEYALICTMHNEII